MECSEIGMQASRASDPQSRRRSHLLLLPAEEAPDRGQREGAGAIRNASSRRIIGIGDRKKSRQSPLIVPRLHRHAHENAESSTLLAQLAAAGARLRYHGDFDWAGLAIGNFVMREFGADPWRFGEADYLAASAVHGIALRGGRSVIAQWDPGLAAAMEARGVVVHEEGVAEMLIMDLAMIKD